VRLVAALSLLATPALGDTPYGGTLSNDGGTEAMAGGAGPPTPIASDAEVRIGREAIVQRGATNLAEALSLLPELVVRAAGRGGDQVDIRGARKGAVMLILDGVPIADPYYGTFDISSIPSTDIEEIRISAAPASPLSGPGGAGGVIEVTTLSTSGSRRLQARLNGGTAPGTVGSLTGRTPITSTISVRASGGGAYGKRALAVTLPNGAGSTVNEAARSGFGTVRAERLGPISRLFADLWAVHKRYTVPPGDEPGAEVLKVDGETSFRLGLGGETIARGWGLFGQGFAQILNRDSLRFGDATFATTTGSESLTADRSGLFARANRWLGGVTQLALTTTFLSEAASVTAIAGPGSSGRTSVAELAAGIRTTPRPWVQLDVSAGLAVPFTDAARPWPEGKLVATVTPTRWLQLQLIGAEKGRTPTVRERFAASIGDPDVRPEKSSYGEGAVNLFPLARLRVRAAGYARHTRDLIRFDATRSSIGNIGDVTVRGAHTELELVLIRNPWLHGSPFAAPYLTIGGSYDYAYAGDIGLGGNAVLDFLPRHRGEAVVTARFRDRVGGWLRVRYLGERTDQASVLAGYTSLDLAAWLRVYPWTLPGSEGADGSPRPGSRSSIRLTARAENLTDTEYQLRANIAGFGTTVQFGAEGIWE
jgi:hypothetical protein